MPEINRQLLEIEWETLPEKVFRTVGTIIVYAVRSGDRKMGKSVTVSEVKFVTAYEVINRNMVGTIEACPSLKYAVDGKMMGILRIDLKSEYEQWPVLKELMDVLICHIYEDFEVASIIMKIQKDAGERQKLIKEYQFVAAREECNISLEDYYIRYC